MSLQERLAKLSQADKEKNKPEETSKQLKSSDLGSIKHKLHRRLIDEIGTELEKSYKNSTLLHNKVRDKLQELLAEVTTPLSLPDKNEIIAQVTDNVLGYGPIEPYLKDAEITEIMINDPNTIYIERFGKIQATDTKFLNEAHLRRVIDKIVGEV